MPKKVGPNALKSLLADLGLELVKTTNVRANIGYQAEHVMCRHFNITISDPPNVWSEVVRNVEQSAPPMPETDMLNG